MTTKNQQCKFTTNNQFCAKHLKMHNDKKVIQTIEIPINNNKKSSNSMTNHNNEKQEIKEDLSMKIEIGIECQCCYDICEKNKMIGCMDKSNNHSVCWTCMNTYIETIINDKKKIKCIYDSKCLNEYDECELLTILDDKIRVRYLEYKAVDEATRLAPLLDNYHICPFCSQYGVIIENYPQYNANNIQQNHYIQNIMCENIKCGIMWCIKCRKAYHGSESCNKIYVCNKGIIKKTIDEVIDNAIIHNCPKCFTKYNKEDGCNLMTCPSCGSYSCYVCNMLIRPINGQKYWHFKSSALNNNQNTCTLYNTNINGNDNDIKKGNLNFNNKRIISALHDFININKNNPDIMLAIENDIVERGYKEFESKKPYQKKKSIVKQQQNKKPLPKKKSS